MRPGFCFGISAAELVDDSVPLAAVLARGDELVERLAAADGWVRRFSVLDQVLGASLHREVGVDPCLVQVWRRLVSADGPSVAQVADEVGWSRQHVTRRIVAETGVTPRHLRHLARFQRSTALLASGASHACVAADAGYLDQPPPSDPGLAGPRWVYATGLDGGRSGQRTRPHQLRTDRSAGGEVHHKGEHDRRDDREGDHQQTTRSAPQRTDPHHDGPPDRGTTSAEIGGPSGSGRGGTRTISWLNGAGRLSGAVSLPRRRRATPAPRSRVSGRAAAVR